MADVVVLYCIASPRGMQYNTTTITNAVATQHNKPKPRPLEPLLFQGSFVALVVVLYNTRTYATLLGTYLELSSIPLAICTIPIVQISQNLKKILDKRVFSML